MLKKKGSEESRRRGNRREKQALLRHCKLLAKKGLEHLSAYQAAEDRRERRSSEEDVKKRAQECFRVLF